MYVPWGQRMLSCHLTLWDECDSCFTHIWIQQWNNLCRLQTSIRVFRIKRVYNQIKHLGQPGKSNNQKISYPMAMQANACRTPQSLSQRRQASDSDFQGPFYKCPCNYRQQVPTSTVGLPHSPGWTHIKHAAPVSNRSVKIGIQGHKWPLWLEPLSSCPSWVQGGHLQVSQIQRFLGK